MAKKPRAPVKQNNNIGTTKLAQGKDADFGYFKDAFLDEDDPWVRKELTKLGGSGYKFSESPGTKTIGYSFEIKGEPCLLAFRVTASENTDEEGIKYIFRKGDKVVSKGDYDTSDDLSAKSNARALGETLSKSLTPQASKPNVEPTGAPKVSKPPTSKELPKASAVQKAATPQAVEPPISEPSASQNVEPPEIEPVAEPDEEVPVQEPIVNNDNVPLEPNPVQEPNVSSDVPEPNAAEPVQSAPEEPEQITEPIVSPSVKQPKQKVPKVKAQKTVTPVVPDNRSQTAPAANTPEVQPSVQSDLIQQVTKPFDFKNKKPSNSGEGQFSLSEKTQDVWRNLKQQNDDFLYTVSLKTSDTKPELLRDTFVKVSAGFYDIFKNGISITNVSEPSLNGVYHQTKSLMLVVLKTIDGSKTFTKNITSKQPTDVNKHLVEFTNEINNAIRLKEVTFEQLGKTHFSALLEKDPSVSSQDDYDLEHEPNFSNTIPGVPRIPGKQKPVVQTDPTEPVNSNTIPGRPIPKVPSATRDAQSEQELVNNNLVLSVVPKSLKESDGETIDPTEISKSASLQITDRDFQQQFMSINYLESVDKLVFTHYGDQAAKDVLESPEIVFEYNSRYYKSNKESKTIPRSSLSNNIEPTKPNVDSEDLDALTPANLDSNQTLAKMLPGTQSLVEVDCPHCSEKLHVKNTNRNITCPVCFKKIKLNGLNKPTILESSSDGPDNLFYTLIGNTGITESGKITINPKQQKQKKANFINAKKKSPTVASTPNNTKPGVPEPIRSQNGVTPLDQEVGFGDERFDTPSIIASANTLAGKNQVTKPNSASQGQKQNNKSDETLKALKEIRLSILGYFSQHIDDFKELIRTKEDSETFQNWLKDSNLISKPAAAPPVGAPVQNQTPKRIVNKKKQP